MDYALIKFILKILPVITNIMPASDVTNISIKQIKLNRNNVERYKIKFIFVNLIFCQRVNLKVWIILKK